MPPDIGMKSGRSPAALPSSSGSPGRRGVLSFYGPHPGLATKMIGAVYEPARPEPVAVERWYSDQGDARADQALAARVAVFFKSHQVREVKMGEQIAGCPHEPGVDYPAGGACPMCPQWARTR